MARAPHPTVLLIFYADNHTIRVSCQIPYNMKQVHCSAPGPRKGSPRTFLPRITSCRTTEHVGVEVWQLRAGAAGTLLVSLGDGVTSVTATNRSGKRVYQSAKDGG
jgi:hypothetical protein